MNLLSLKITQLRNITQQSYTFSPQFNLFYGLNGSGKTSVLEAIYLLGLGRSFRSRDFNRVIQREADFLSVFGEVSDDKEFVTPVGIERYREGDLKIRIAGENAKSSAELAHNLPLKLINTDSYQLLTQGPQIRRQFLDWGLFHVEQRYLELWRSVQRLLKQRNMLLKSQPRYSELEVWDQQLIIKSEEIDILRRAYLTEFKEVFPGVLGQLLEMDGINLGYSPGWDSKKDYRAVLEQNFSRDCMLGFTQSGCHRADVFIKAGRYPAADILSRGQQKLLVNALLLVQGMLLKSSAGKNCIYLIDDLPAELDGRHRANMAQLLAAMEAQVFVTGVEKSDLSTAFQPYSPKMFHVEHGEAFLLTE